MNEINQILMKLSLSTLTISLFIALLSLVKLDTFLKKLVSLEVITNQLLAGIVFLALFTERPVYIDVCLTLSLIMFIVNVTYYHYISKRSKYDV